MFYEKKVLVFDRGQLKRGHRIKLTLHDKSTGSSMYQIDGMIARVDDYNMRVFDDKRQDYASIYVGEIEGHPETEPRTIYFTIDEVKPTKYSEK